MLSLGSKTTWVAARRRRRQCFIGEVDGEIVMIFTDAHPMRDQVDLAGYFLSGLRIRDVRKPASIAYRCYDTTTDTMGGPGGTILYQN